MDSIDPAQAKRLQDEALAQLAAQAPAPGGGHAGAGREDSVGEMLRRGQYSPPSSGDGGDEFDEDGSVLHTPGLSGWGDDASPGGDYQEQVRAQNRAREAARALGKQASRGKGGNQGFLQKYNLASKGLFAPGP